MKKIVFAFILALTVMAIFACVSIDMTSGNRRGKKASGRISIYTSMYGDVVENMEKILAGQFPEYEIDFSFGGTGILQARIEQEIALGRLGCDILLVAEPSYSLELKEKNMLHPHKSSEASALAFDYDPDGYWYPVRISNMVLAYNPRINAKNSVPNSFYDFAYDSSLNGAISMRNPIISGTTLATIAALKDKYGYEYFDALGRQNVNIDYSTSEAIEKLESGEYKAAMILEESILKAREEGSRLEVIYPSDGAVVVPSTIMILNDEWSANRNTKAAEAIVDWFLSPEGQNAIVAGWMHSARANFNKLPYGAIPTNEIRANSLPVNWESIFRNREEIRYRFQDGLIFRR